TKRVWAAWPSTVAETECGSTPDPVSLTATTTELRFAEMRRRRGGVVSFFQNRNWNGPAAAAERESKTMSYVPGAGNTAPATGRAWPNVFRYGFSVCGSPA